MKYHQISAQSLPYLIYHSSFLHASSRNLRGIRRSTLRLVPTLDWVAFLHALSRNLSDIRRSPLTACGDDVFFCEG